MADDDSYSSICPELDIVSCGDTEKQALANLDDALELYFDDIEPTDLWRRLTWDITDSLEIFQITDKKAEIEKSRQQVLQTIQTALGGDLRTNGSTPKRAFLLTVEPELVNAPA